MMPGRERAGGEDGFVGGFEGLLFGLLLFVLGTLFVANVWGVIDTKAATEDAARQAARTYVESPSAATGELQATQAADATLVGYGRNPRLAHVSLASGGFQRCVRVTITVSYPAPLLFLPILGRVGTGERVKAAHSELVDPFRSGLPGTASCA